MKKRIMSIFLIVFFIISLSSISVIAASDLIVTINGDYRESNGYYYLSNENSNQFKIGVVNKTTTAQDVTLLYELIGPNGNVKKDSAKVKVEPKTTETAVYECDVLIHGEYSLKVTASSASGLSAEKTRSFYALQVNEGKSYNNRVGVCTHIEFGRNAGLTTNAVSAAGFGFERETIEWSRLESKKGQKQFPNRMLQFYDFVKQEEMGVIMPLFFGNKYYATKEDYLRLPSSGDYQTEYLNYIEAMIEQYGDVVDYYEVWNEPNIPAFNHDDTISGAAYVEVLKAAYTKIKTLDPTAKVVGVALAGGYNGDAKKFIQEVLDAGGGNYMDIVSVHPYSHNNTPEEKLNYDLSSFKKLLTDANVKKPIWLSEYGYYTIDGGYSEETQGQYFIRGAALYDSWCKDNADDISNIDYNGKYIWYELQDGGTDSTYSENRFGLIDTDYKPKESYYAAAAFNKFTSGMRFDELKINGNNYVAIYKSTDGKRNTAVLWNAKSTGNVNVTVLGKKAKSYNMYGDLIGEVSTTSTVETSSSPVFVVGYNNKTSESTVISDVNVTVGDTTEDGYKTVTVSGKIADAIYGKNVGITMLPQNALFADISERNVLGNAYINTVATDENGNFNDTFTLRGQGSTYNLTLTTENAAPVNKTIVVGTRSTAFVSVEKDNIRLETKQDIKKGDDIKIIGEYNGEGGACLISKVCYTSGEVSYEYVPINADEKSNTIELKVSTTDDVAEINVFLWDSFKGLMPLLPKTIIK